MEVNVVDKGEFIDKEWRLSAENLLPQRITTKRGTQVGYNIYPYHSLATGRIFNGYKSLAEWIANEKIVIIDGFHGVFWGVVRHCLAQEFDRLNVRVKWINITDSMKPEQEIESLVTPYLGKEDSVWGTKCKLDLIDFFDISALDSVLPDQEYDLNVVFGTGSGLLSWDASLVYLDVPKNEIQYRFRAGSMGNLGTSQLSAPTEMYKRCYFIDWPVLNKHKQNIITRAKIIADAQWKDSLNWIFNADLKEGLNKCANSVFRVRPWFEAGAWGGHWMKGRINGLNKDEINYAWSFELIVPENGLVFESDGYLLEISFDFLMYTNAVNVLGKHTEIFGTEFPIRFDFLDTFDGGNLSIQCHPSLDYIRKEFGENITQDETYYILDCKPGARVFLGFQGNIDPQKFEQALEESQQQSKEIDIEQFVQSLPAEKHDLFLIPNGTVHSAGTNNMVLEISATPYIFTFKMYDWMRLGLDGQPRPINIDHAFNNLKFDRKGEKVQKELISTPSVISEGPDWELVHLPTHAEHFYDVHRIEFDTEAAIETENTCHILMLVEGEEIALETADGTSVLCHYAETFVVPAAARSYRLINKSRGRAKVVKAFVKNDWTLLKQFKT